jgi:type IV secretion system protein VirB2
MTARRLPFAIAVAGLVLLVAAQSSFAASAGMPWEGPLNNLLRSLSGPVARVIGAVSIIMCGFAVAFSEGGSALRKALWVVLGLAISFNALTWGLSFMGFSGGLVV